MLIETITPLAFVTLCITLPLFAVFSSVSDRWKTKVSDIENKAEICVGCRLPDQTGITENDCEKLLFLPSMF